MFQFKNILKYGERPLQVIDMASASNFNKNYASRQSKPQLDFDAPDILESSLPSSFQNHPTLRRQKTATIVIDETSNKSVLSAMDGKPMNVEFNGKEVNCIDAIQRNDIPIETIAKRIQTQVQFEWSKANYSGTLDLNLVIKDLQYQRDRYYQIQHSLSMRLSGTVDTKQNMNNISTDLVKIHESSLNSLKELNQKYVDKIEAIEVSNSNSKSQELADAKREFDAESEKLLNEYAEKTSKVIQEKATSKTKAEIEKTMKDMDPELSKTDDIAHDKKLTDKEKATLSKDSQSMLERIGRYKLRFFGLLLAGLATAFFAQLVISKQTELSGCFVTEVSKTKTDTSTLSCKINDFSCTDARNKGKLCATQTDYANGRITTPPSVSVEGSVVVVRKSAECDNSQKDNCDRQCTNVMWKSTFLKDNSDESKAIVRTFECRSCTIWEAMNYIINSVLSEILKAADQLFGFGNIWKWLLELLKTIAPYAGGVVAVILLYYGFQYFKEKPSKSSLAGTSSVIIPYQYHEPPPPPPPPRYYFDRQDFERQMYRPIY